MSFGLTGLLAALQIVNPVSDTLPARVDSMTSLRDSVLEYIYREPSMAEMTLPFLMSASHPTLFPAKCVYSFFENEEENYAASVGICLDLIGRSALYASDRTYTLGEVRSRFLVDWFFDEDINICDIDFTNSEGETHHEFQPSKNCVQPYSEILRNFVKRNYVKSKTQF